MQFKNPDYFLARLSETSWIRCCHPEGFNMPEITNSHLGISLSEEVGEVAGVLKRLNRGFTERDAVKLAKKLNEESEKIAKLTGIIGKIWKPGREGDFEEMEKIFYSRLRDKLADEIADVFIYLDLLATKNGVDIWGAIKDKFNRVSDEMNCPQFKIH